MKKAVFLILLIVVFPAMAFAQEKVEAPAWNVGDKWVFTGNGSIEVVKADQSGYILKFSDKNCIFESQECSAIFFDKATRNRINSVEGDKRKKYKEGLSKIFNFPLSIGKQWKWNYPGIAQGWGGSGSVDFYEDYKISGWEDIGVGAGKFKALRLEYLRHFITPTGIKTGEIKHVYWYSPDIKYFVKCQYDKDWMKDKKEFFNWELTSFQLKK
jgi:hypothetical protein